MSMLSISRRGALDPIAVNRHQSQNQVIVGSTQLSKVPFARVNPLSAAPLEAIPIVEPPKNHQHVVVVGAGISGLRAASVLQRHGISVTILEGRPDRIGGRICTSRKNGKAARDIGKYT